MGMSLDAGKTQGMQRGWDRARQGQGLNTVCHEHHCAYISMAAFQARGRIALSDPLAVGLGGGANELWVKAICVICGLSLRLLVGVLLELPFLLPH